MKGIEIPMLPSEERFVPVTAHALSFLTSAPAVLSPAPVPWRAWDEGTGGSATFSGAEDAPGCHALSNLSAINLGMRNPLLV